MNSLSFKEYNNYVLNVYYGNIIKVRNYYNTYKK